MEKNINQIEPSYTLNELCVLADIGLRTARYYVQAGLLDRPEGATRAARYGAGHLEQLLLIKKWSAAGVSLDRVRELLHGEKAPVPPRSHSPGSIEIRSHLTVADGIEVVIAPKRAGMSPEQVRHFIKNIMELYEKSQSTG